MVELSPKEQIDNANLNMFLCLGLFEIMFMKYGSWYYNSNMIEIMSNLRLYNYNYDSFYSVNPFDVITILDEL